MLSLREMMHINHMREVHSFQIFSNGFLALCTVDQTSLKVPVYDAAGNLIRNTDTDPFGRNMTYRVGVYVDIDPVAGKILRTDEIEDTVVSDVTYNKFYALDFHGNMLMPHTMAAPAFVDVPQIPTQVSELPPQFTRLGPGLMANGAAHICQDHQFYQIPTNPELVIARRDELMTVLDDNRLDQANYVFLEGYSTRLQMVHSVVAPDADNFIRYAQIRNTINKKYQIQEILKR